MIVKAAEGLVILDPSTLAPLPPEGLTIADGDLHWSRMERDGDVTIEPDAPVADVQVADVGSDIAGADSANPPKTPTPRPVSASSKG